MTLPRFIISFRRSVSAAVSTAAMLALLPSCSLISTCDQKAYENATSLKVDAKNTMALATEGYATHADEVKAFRTSLEKAYEYDAGRPQNEITVKQWDKLLNPEGDLLGGYLSEWKTEGRLLPGYVRSKQTQIARAFDTIIGLESGKLKPSDLE